MPTAFARVQGALDAYLAAFQRARAEAAAAIAEAAAAERATAAAKQEHQQAVRRAATAEPGTPEAHVASFTDPGSTGLANAQARYETARASLQHTGDESAATIHTATDTPNGDINITDGLTSDDWERVGLPFLSGLWGAFCETVSSAWELLPFQAMIEDMQGGQNWPEAYGEHWKEIGEGYAFFRSQPWDAIVEVFREMIAYDYWEDSPAEALGRATFNFAGLTGLGKAFLKLGKGAPDHLPELNKLQTGGELRVGEFARGTSDGGPGVWSETPIRTKGADYQEFITGMERGTEYKIDNVDFDGYDSERNVLLDAKDWRNWPPADKDFWHETTIDKAIRQVAAADGTLVEWHFSTLEKKTIVDDLLSKDPIANQVVTVYTPFE